MNPMFWKKTDNGPEPDPSERTAMMDSANQTPAPLETVDKAAEVATEATAEATAPAEPAVNRTHLEGRVIEAISSIFDPEIPVNIYELGLIYDIEITPQADVVIEMTLTSPACPVAGSLPGDVEKAVAAAEGVRAADVRLVWDPPWTPDRMTEGAKLELGFM